MQKIYAFFSYWSPFYFPFMKWRLPLFILPLLCTVASFAQSNKGTIKGRILAADGEPAAFVPVGLKNTKYGTTTDDKGYYSLKVPAGSHILLVQFVGHEPEEKQVEVKENETVTVEDFSLRENSKELTEVVVTGSSNKYREENASQSLRLATPLLETPQNIQVVTNDALKDQQVISMSDGLIRNVSGLVRSEHWGDMYTNVTARGGQVQAFRNGFNVVNSYWGPLTEDMSFVDRIEFVKGPAGFMLSNGDPCGLYNVVTKKPTGKRKGEAIVTVGSYDLYRAALDLDGKLTKNGKLLYRLNLAAQNKKSHRAYEFNDRYTIAPVISYQISPATKLTAEYTYQRANMSNVGSFYVFSPEGFASLPVDFTNMAPGLPATHANDHSFLLNVQHAFSKKWKITAQGGHFLYQQTGSSMWPSVVNPDGTLIRGVNSWEAASQLWLGQVFVNGEFTTGPVVHKLLGGIDVGDKIYYADWSQGHDLDSAGAPFNPKAPNYGAPVNGYPNFDFETIPLTDRAGGKINQRYGSFYLQDELGFFENKFRLTLAGRYTYVYQGYGADGDTASRFSPRIGLSYSINKRTSLYALYDQAFIPQSGILTNGNKVRPITGNNIEFGLKRDWLGGKWSTTLAVYAIVKNHELTADPTNQNPNLPLSIELGQKRAQGIEFDLIGNIAKGLNLTANYAYTDSKVTKVAEGITTIEVGDVVPGFSKHTANAWLSYKLQSGILKGTGASLGFTYLVDRATYWEMSPDNKPLDDYFKLDAGLFWENSKIKVTANMFNVLNEYLYSGSWYSWNKSYYWQTEAPRNGRVSVSYKF